MLQEHAHVDEFTAFVEDVEPKLKIALCANFGKDLGMEATAEALAFAWEHWDRVSSTANPAGYLYGVAQTSKGVYQLLEALDGVDLDRLIRAQASVPPALGVWLALQVCEALAHAHSLGIVHGNLTPHEVLISRQGHLKVDFGLARAELQEAALTDWVDIRYVSPTAARDAQGDLYACASMLWELISGRPYRSVVDLSPQGLVYTPLPLQQALPALDESLAAVLDIKSAQPIQSARALSDALTRVFYGALDAEEERDGKRAISALIAQIAPEEEELLGRYRPTQIKPQELKPQAGLFTQAIAARDQPVRPSPISTEDVRLDTEAVSADSTWSPGQELAGALQLQDARLTVGIPQVRGLMGEEAKAEQRTEHVRSEPDHPLAALAEESATMGPATIARDVPPKAESLDVPLPVAKPAPPKWLWFLAGFAITFSILLVRNVLS